MKQQVTITKCIHQCPFYQTSMQEMNCNHPAWAGADPYDNMIITQENGREGFPEKCPLRKEELTITYKLKNGSNR